MANQWAIAIGINTYRAFQSLNYAQQDAEALCRHLIDSGITAPENCLLLTTASALHRGQSTFPERETIAKWLKGLVTGGMGPDDSLILFFSGYGVHANGEDYLMPVDGDPADAAATGIAVKSIYRLLTQVPSGKVLIALDMNRNAGSLGEPAGAYSARIAQQASQQYPEIATLLSCEPPEQFARESAGLRHGFFTAGILDVLRSSQRNQPGESLDFKGFGTQLRDRMAELCEHYWRPVQTPVTIGSYSIPLGQTAASALVSDGVANNGGLVSDGKVLDVEASGGGASSINGSVDSWDWGNAIAVADGESNPATSGTAISGTANGSRPVSPTENILNPLDISRPADVSEGFGDDFANTWAWSLDGEGQNGSASNDSVNGNSTPGNSSNGNTSSAAEEYDPDLDPYAAAWEEDFGDTVPFDANSDVVLNAQAQLAQQNADLNGDSSSVLGKVNSGTPGNGLSSQGIAGEPEPVQGGRPGHGGDGTDWHWADLSVAAATEDVPMGSGLDDAAELYSEAGLDNEAASIFEYPDRTSPNGFPEPGPNASANGNANGSTNGGLNGTAAAGLAGAGLVIATRPGMGQGNGSGTTSPLNPTQTVLDQEDPNWNWSGGETAIDVEPHDDGNGSGLNGHLDNSSGIAPEEFLDYDEQLQSAAEYEAVDADWPEHALDLDDDPEGLPIVDLESEEFAPLIDQEQDESSGRPAWLSLRLIGALGITSLIGLGLLGFFRGSEGDGVWPQVQMPKLSIPKLQNKFSLPSGVNLPGSWSGNRDGELEDNDSTVVLPGTGGLANGDGNTSTSSSPAGGEAAGGDGTTVSASPTETTPSAQSNPNGNGEEPDSSGSPNGTAPEFSEGEVSNALLSNAQQRIQAGQASSLNRAIDQARKVPPSDPDYDRARQSMNQWSQEVLTLAQQRAQEGEYLQAIATARLVPSDLAGFSEAQQSISQWQIPAQLEHAKAVIRPGQASSYNRAIGVARNVPEGNDSHPEAQKLMQGWGNNIFEIAQQRANQKQWGMAIAAAELVPPDMPAYGAAQSAIADWQPQLNKPK